jgi:hypothetical protein
MSLVHHFQRGIKTVRPSVYPLRFLTLGTIITFMLMACGGNSPPPAATSENSATTQSSTAEQSNPPSRDNLPGTDEFGMTREELVENSEKVESLIADCMSEAGFEYIAADFATVRRGMVSDKSLPGLSEQEFFEQYGYGVSTLYTGLPPQQADVNTPAKIGLGERNVQIYNNLSPADQIAYNRTLFGENTNATFAVSLEAENFARTGGCTRAAIEQVFTPEQLAVTYLNPLNVLIEQDPRMAAALADFGECVRAEGFDYSHPEEIENDMKNRLYAITDGAPVESLSADARSALAELQTLERAVAIVAFRCEVRILEPVEDRIERELYAAPVQ